VRALTIRDGRMFVAARGVVDAIRTTRRADLVPVWGPRDAKPLQRLRILPALCLLA
jgi:hypothetical protein